VAALTEVSAASPSDPPTCREVLTSPETAPACDARTAAVTAMMRGAMTRPAPTDMRIPSPNMLDR